MKKIILIIALLIGCDSSLSEKELLHKSNPDGHYGVKFSNLNKSTIQNLIANENQYLERDVFVSGEIIEVCPMRGCWIKLNDKRLFLLLSSENFMISKTPRQFRKKSSDKTY